MWIPFSCYDDFVLTVSVKHFTVKILIVEMTDENDDMGCGADGSGTARGWDN